ALSGWKRCLVLSVGINVLVFLLRVGTLGKYNSLGIQYHYFDELVTPEMYNDFEFWYLSWVEPFLDGGFLNPYSVDFLGHQFPPLFIYTLGLFALIPFVPIWKVAIPIFLYHISTGILVREISLKLSKQEKVATVAMLFYYLNPLGLVYASFCWFNPPAFTFYVVLAFYLALLSDQKFQLFGVALPSRELSLVALGIATMYKQFAAIFLPLLIIILLKQKDREETGTANNILDGILHSFIYGGTVLAIALPFLLLDFNMFTYRTLVTTTEFGIEFNKMISYSTPVNFNTFFVLLGFPKIITDIIGNLIISWAFLGAFTASICLVCWLESSKIQEDMDIEDRNSALVKNALFWALMLAFSVHLFYPRGVFKFYLLLLTPFVSILLSFRKINGVKATSDSYIIGYDRKKTSWKAPFVLFILLLIIVLINRFVYFILLIIWIANYLLQKSKGGSAPSENSILPS
ncbi:MAG: hypothetical protein ACFFD4_30580, partial [Candidatus Odinarchaeota archaeon]